MIHPHPTVSRARQSIHRKISVVLIGSLAACSNISDDTTRTQAEGAAVGAAAGAAVGAGVGALAGKNKGAAAAGGALAGAVAGGLAGAAYGSSVAKKKGEYAGVEDSLDTRLATIEQDSARRRSYNGKLATMIERRKAQLADVLAAGDPPGTSADEFDLRTSLATAVKDIDRQARNWQDAIDAHKAALKDLSAEPRVAELEQGIEGLTAQRAEMLRRRGELTAIGEKLNR